MKWKVQNFKFNRYKDNTKITIKKTLEVAIFMIASVRRTANILPSNFNLAFNYKYFWSVTIRMLYFEGRTFYYFKKGVSFA